MSDSDEQLKIHSIKKSKLIEHVAKVRHYIQKNAGLKMGDVVAGAIFVKLAYAPNCAETLIFYLASVSIGVIFTGISPDLGVQVQ